MENNQSGSVTNGYRVDLVMCIDGTGSMRDRIEKTKTDVMNFYALFLDMMARQDKYLLDDALRVKVIVFRDYKEDDYPAMEESPFYSIVKPEENEMFQKYVSGISADGGGDAAENAFEAIYFALKSDWVRRGGRYRRHAIILFTDAGALPLQDPDRKNKPGYPIDAPESFDDLGELFEYGNQELSFSPKNGRLIVFAPKDCGWEKINTWERTYHIKVENGGGCKEVELDEALGVLVASF